jgi:hypothetical protein
VTALKGSSGERTRVLFISIAPRHNNCGGRIVMHRHLMERNPFELHVASEPASLAEILIIVVVQTSNR